MGTGGYPNSLRRCVGDRASGYLLHVLVHQSYTATNGRPQSVLDGCLGSCIGRPSNPPRCNIVCLGELVLETPEVLTLPERWRILPNAEDAPGIRPLADYAESWLPPVVLSTVPVMVRR